MLLKIPVKKSAKKNVVAYRLQKGETLYTIARRFNTSVAILTSLNKIEDASNLPTGKVIYVPNS
jgi:LysM repeat protein